MNNTFKWQNVAPYTLAYLLWLLTLCMCIRAVLEIQVTANAVWVAIKGDPYSLGLINQLSVILGGLVALIYLFALEEDYRNAVTLRRTAKPENFPKGKIVNQLANLGIDILLRRFVIAIAIPLGLFLFCLAAVEIAVRAMPS
jgi:hypothetical protein